MCVGICAIACGAADPGADTSFSPAVDVSAHPNQEPEPILTVPIFERAELAFYEPEPGYVFAVERISQAQSSASSFLAHKVAPGASAVDIYSALRPDEPVPESLLAAQERVDARLVSHLPSSEPPDKDSRSEGEPQVADLGPPGRKLQHAGSGAHFENDHMACTFSGARRSFCWLERTGDWTEPERAKHERHHVMNYGSVTFTLKVFAGSASLALTVLPGDLRIVTGIAGESCDFLGLLCTLEAVNMKGQILQATGAAWHWGGAFWTSEFIVPPPVVP